MFKRFVCQLAARPPATGFGTRRTGNSQQDLIPCTPLKKKPRHIAGACVSKGPLRRSGCLATAGKAKDPQRPDQQNGTRRQRHGRQCGVEESQRRGVLPIRKRRTLLESDDKIGAHTNRLSAAGRPEQSLGRPRSNIDSAVEKVTG